MGQTFLLEIGLEEMPAHVVSPSVNQLAQRMSDFLKKQRLDFSGIEKYSTPRRLAVIVTGLADKQTDIKEEAKGPAKKIAVDKDGNWSRAAQGFSRGQGVSPDQIYFKEFKGTEYAFVEKAIIGQPTKTVLGNVSEVIKGMRFPTMMRWKTNDFEFVRPIRWLVGLLDDEVVPFKILNVNSNRISAGHRFLGKSVSLNNASEYPEKLLSQMVVVDVTKRKNMIREQIDSLAQKNQWKIVVDEDLLEEVNNLVEYPTVFAGTFSKKYLSLPDEVLITSMKDHQRFFYVLDNAGQMLPKFVSVRNGDKEYLDNVIAGNEKVLTARLEDAKFFYEEDQQTPIKDDVERLKDVMFHDKIGTVYEKMQRVTFIGQYLGKIVGLSVDDLRDLKQAAQIYKFDLVSEMVGEFAELQGVMGKIYARSAGENENVANAIRESYLPLGSESDLPQTNVGSLLSIADKIDSIQSFFAAGMFPSGSNDPYALRRQALGIIRISLAEKWDLSVAVLAHAINFAAQQDDKLYKNTQPEQNLSKWQKFILDRIEQQLTEQKYSYDIVAAVVEAQENTTFQEIFSAADVLTKHQTDPDFKESIEALTRTVRIASKNETEAAAQVDPALFENNSEKLLFAAVNELEKTYPKEGIEDKFDALTSLRQPISDYFDETMVMAEDPTVRKNRLAQLNIIAQMTYSFGKLDNLNVK